MIKYETDSRKVQAGQTFVAIKGYTVDGHDFIHDAIKNGATKIIAEREVDVSVPVEVVDDTQKYLKEVLAREYSPLLKKLKIIGVTGTNGKTTTCYLTYELFKKLDVKVAYMGTIGFFFEDMEISLPNTTPEILTVYKLFLDVLEKGCTTIVMEVSSHALSLERIAGLEFSIGAFTNLTEDHLDYHKTMENYLSAKLRILDYMDPNGIFIVNADDPASSSFSSKYAHTVSLGLKESTYQILNYQIYPDHTSISFTYQNTTYECETNLTGMFNIYNFLTSLAILHEYGFSLMEILKKSLEIYPPRGRCDTIKVLDGYVVIDYAHTPDAVEKMIDTYRTVGHGRIITLIGCGGDRDPLKRPIMGKIATEKSDFVLFTNDNPRTEDPQKIMNDILEGISTNNYKIIFDRREAIKTALDMIQKEDIVLLLGKGHEDYQILGHEKIHFDDKEEVLNYIKNHNF